MNKSLSEYSQSELLNELKRKTGGECFIVSSAQFQHKETYGKLKKIFNGLVSQFMRVNFQSDLGNNIQISHGDKIFESNLFHGKIQIKINSAIEKEKIQEFRDLNGSRFFYYDNYKDTEESNNGETRV